MEDVAKWRSSVVAKNRSEIQDVDQEIENLRKAVANLQQQIETLRRSRDEIAKREEHLGDEEVERSYNAVFAALGDQSGALSKRAVAAADLEIGRNKAIESALADPSMADTVAGYQQFKTAFEPSLASMPESLRTPLRMAHEANTNKLRDHLANAKISSPELSGDALSVEVVYAVDAPEGTPEVVMLVLPVKEQVQTEWSSRREDLSTRVAARVIQGLYSAATAAGLNKARAAFGGHQGLLAVEMEIAGAPADFSAKLQEELSRALGSARELAAAKLEVVAREVPVDHLLPPETATEAQNA